MRRTTVFLALCLTTTGYAGCKKDPPAPPPPRVSRTSPGAPSNRPAFPAQTLSTNARRDCFPEGFEATRVRLRGALVQLCGLVAGTPRCYEIDPIANRVEETPAPDAPLRMPSEMIFEGPFQRTEIASRAWRTVTAT